ncbi:MAG TPA: chemotaxis protein CheW, partial [Myxococcota bacterium]|nr:chemotaxis protein CheW [Myxococcota bacterium]
MTHEPTPPPPTGEAAEADEPAAEALVTFRIGETWLAVSAQHVEEICGAVKALPIPRVPDYIPGLMNLRGHAVPLLSLQRFLQLPAGGADEDTGRIVLVNVNGMRVGLLCDQVRSLEQVAHDRLTPPTAVEGQVMSPFARAQVNFGFLYSTWLDLA